MMPWLPSMQGQILLTLCWRSFSWWGNKVFRMRKWQCRIFLCLQKLRIGRLCITASKSISNYVTYKTKNCWSSVDAHFQNGAETVLLPLLPIKAANTAIILNYYQLSFELPDLRDQKLLTLYWRSLSWWCNEDILHCFDYTGSQYIVYARHCHSYNPRCKAIYRWRSFSEVGSDRTAYLVADKGWQYAAYNSLQLFTTQMTNDAIPKIIHAPLMLIFGRGQLPYRIHFCQ